MRFSSKVVLVTGAASGIGLGAALRFAAEGASVVLVDRDAAALPAAGAKLEVGKPQDVAAAIAFLASDEAAFIQGASLLVDGGRLCQL